MAGVRFMLARVRRLERTGSPALSPFERDYGSLDAFVVSVRADVAAGRLDRIDLLGMDGNGGVLRAILRWHADGAWQPLR